MAYSKTNWSNGEAPAINGTNLNKIEQGIYDATYVDGIKVGTSIDSNYKTNILFSKNLFDKNNVVAGYLSNAGNVVSNPSFSTSDFIELNGATKITIDNSTGQSENVCFYNSSKTFISYLSTTTNTRMTIDVPSNAKYVRATIGNTNLNIYIIQKGTTIITPTINVDGEDIYVKVQNEVYSTTEQVIGTYLGKPLYRRVFTGTTSTTTDNTMLTSSGNIKKIISSKGYIEQSSSVQLEIGKNIYHQDSSFFSFTRVINVNNNIRFDYNHSVFSGKHFEVAVEYTKTTD